MINFSSTRKLNNNKLKTIQHPSKMQNLIAFGTKKRGLIKTWTTKQSWKNIRKSIIKRKHRSLLADIFKDQNLFIPFLQDLWTLRQKDWRALSTSNHVETLWNRICFKSANFKRAIIWSKNRSSKINKINETSQKRVIKNSTSTVSTGRRIKVKKLNKTIRFLKHTLKSKLSYLFFQPWKHVRLPLTKKQHWLRKTYVKYRSLQINDRIDFFRTYIGQQILTTEINSYTDAKTYWLSESKFRWQGRSLSNKEHEWFVNKHKELLKPHYTERTALRRLHQKAWWYENLIQKRKPSTNLQKFILDRPNTAFQIHWKEQKRTPWKNSLLFRRALYAGFGEQLRRENKFRALKIRPYLRRKNPRQEKRNRLYQRSQNLLNNFRQRSRICANKKARIKQIVGKILLPFYGHLNFKQFQRIVKQSQKHKSTQLTSNEVILNHFENRLDVVLYRLNLAPSILWARRLISSGSVFLTREHHAKTWDLMYASFKKIAFPLKLRDPKRLYSHTVSNHYDYYTIQYKFLGVPQRKPFYLVKPGDVIQCASGTFLNDFKFNTSLFRKPLSSHFLTLAKPKSSWHFRFNRLLSKTLNSWDQVREKQTAAVMLHNPTFADLRWNDRVNESFFKWFII